MELRTKITGLSKIVGELNGASMGIYNSKEGLINAVSIFGQQLLS
jgi:hypothetical protein